MTPQQIEEHKATIATFDKKISDLEGRSSALKEAKLAFMRSIVTYTLNSADAAHRDCCGSRPRELTFSDWECPTSPIGVCSYNDNKDPIHDHCLFCGDPEERK